MDKKHTPTPWRTGIPGTVVADSPDGITIEGGTGQENVDYYGGNLIGESISDNNAKHIVKCVNLHEDLLNTLIEISEGKGRYDIDPLQHASNTIEDMVNLAKEAIKKASE